MDNLKKEIEAHMAGTEKMIIKNWPGFISGDVLTFFNKNGLEKMTLSDGNGNKATLTRQKNEEIKVETASTALY